MHSYILQPNFLSSMEKNRLAYFEGMSESASDVNSD